MGADSNNQAGRSSVQFILGHQLQLSVDLSHQCRRWLAHQPCIDTLDLAKTPISSLHTISSQHCHSSTVTSLFVVSSCTIQAPELCKFSGSHDALALCCTNKTRVFPDQRPCEQLKQTTVLHADVSRCISLASCLLTAAANAGRSPADAHCKSASVPGIPCDGYPFPRLATLMQGLQQW
jgi:hypothetical protein